MSADNWTTCPRCALRRQEEIKTADEDLARAYGAVTVEQFDAQRAKRDELVKTSPEQTLREDYEFWGISEGEFHVTYRGGCTTCGFEHSFRHDVELDVTT
jgi:hypothetical protein